MYSGKSRKSTGGQTHRNSSFEYKETLDATTRHLEDGSRIINQYKLGKMIGQGAYGNVYHASLLDVPSSEFAVKEFGKTRLRKTFRAQSMRHAGPRKGRPSGQVRRGGHVISGSGVEAAVQGMSAMNIDGEEKKQGTPSKDSHGDGHEKGNDSQPGSSPSQSKTATDDPLSLIRQEIAILKKLHHPHLVRLYEVLDDPSRDELYMVFEYCADGAVINVRLHEEVKPLNEDIARNYLTQIMLGIEYLHHHDIVHRDIKPDNILLQNNRKTCKIVDFGVSEFFIKPGDDTMQKSAGSPAFMSPELCKTQHRDFHGKDSDIWSLGVTFYTMVVGKLPFDKDQFLELYESIQGDEPDYPEHLSSECKDILKKLLAKEPGDRIRIADMRQHPFITQNGKIKVASHDENIKDVVEEVTAEEVDLAINSIASVFTLARAISRFKRAGSRASSAGSISDIASSILSKGKEVSHQASLPISSINEEGGHELGKRQKARKFLNELMSSTGSNEEHASQEEPTLRQVAEAHVVVGSSNSEWAASHIARKMVSAAQHASSKAKDVIRESKEDDERQGSGEEAKEGEEKPKRRGEILHLPNSPHHDDQSDQQDRDSTSAGGSEPEAGRIVSDIQKDGEQALQTIDKKVKEKKSPPKLLPDLPTVSSPAIESLPTPKGASDMYRGKG
jgi:[calcium/calmodulin-dependent protein kinase] kinase